MAERGFEHVEFLGVRPAYANSGNKNSRIGSQMTREAKVWLKKSRLLSVCHLWCYYLFILLLLSHSWVFGMHQYCFNTKKTLNCCYYVLPLLFAVSTVKNLTTVIEVNTLLSSSSFPGLLPRQQQWENTTHPTTTLPTCYLLLHFPQLTNYTDKKQAEEEERSGAAIERLWCE